MNGAAPHHLQDTFVSYYDKQSGQAASQPAIGDFVIEQLENMWAHSGMVRVSRVCVGMRLYLSDTATIKAFNIK